MSVLRGQRHQNHDKSWILSIQIDHLVAVNSDKTWMYWISNMLKCLLLVNLQNPSLLYPSKTVLNLGRTQIFAGKLEFHNLFLVCFFALFLLISGIYFCTKPINYERVLALTHFLKKHEKISKKGDTNYVISFAKILVGVARFFPYTRWVAFVSY